MARHFSKNSRRAIASLDPPYRRLIGPGERRIHRKREVPVKVIWRREEILGIDAIADGSFDLTGGLGRRCYCGIRFFAYSAMLI